MSLKDLEKFRAQQAQKAEKKSSPSTANTIRMKFLNVQPNKSLQIKFLDEFDNDEGFITKWFHFVRRPNQWGNMSNEYKLCLDQDQTGLNDCPWCEERHKIANPKENSQYRRTFQLMTNVLIKDAPIVRKEGDQWIEDGTEDKVQVYRTGITVLDQIEDLYTQIGAVKNTWFNLSRKGATKEDTVYSLTPVYEGRSIKDPEDNTEAQQELVDKYYIDLEPYFEADSRGEEISRAETEEAVSESAVEVMPNPLARR